MESTTFCRNVTAIITSDINTHLDDSILDVVAKLANMLSAGESISIVDEKCCIIIQGE